MNVVKNLLAVVGLITIIVVVLALPALYSFSSQFSGFDEKAMDTYKDMMDNLAKTGNAAEATVWKVKVKAGLSAADVEESMKIVANGHNIKNVGELPLYKEIAAISGKPYRFVKIYMFCNAMTASRMLDYNDAFSAYLPCRVSLVEDKNKQLWVYSLNMDAMIYGGKPLPPELKKEAIKVKTIIQDIMNKGAAGDF
jgi:uncharacterized protein (DUF302 family)